MYGLFTYIYHKFMINVGKYSIHGSYGYETPQNPQILSIESSQTTNSFNPWF